MKLPFRIRINLANETVPVPLVLDLRIPHDRVGSSTDCTLHGHLRYPNNLDQSLNDTTPDKIRKYHTDYNNNPPNTVSFIPLFLLRLGGYIVNLSDFYSYRIIGKLSVFFQLQEFRFREAEAFRINLNLDRTYRI
jgi:hypothetical protein